MTFETFEEIMEFAVDKETEAALFYEEAAKQEEYSGSRETFESFAAEERRHRKMLQGFTEENVDRYKVKKIPDLKRSDYFVEMEFQPGMPYRDILVLAAKREEKAFRFYSDFSERADVAAHQKLFQVLAREEANHKLKLETLLDDYMQRMGD